MGSDGHNFWASRGGRALYCSEEQLRACYEEEEWSPEDRDDKDLAELLKRFEKDGDAVLGPGDIRGDVSLDLPQCWEAPPLEQLRKECRRRGLDKAGTAQELIQKLKQHHVQQTSRLDKPAKRQGDDNAIPMAKRPTIHVGRYPVAGDFLESAPMPKDKVDLVMPGLHVRQEKKRQRLTIVRKPPAEAGEVEEDVPEYVEPNTIPAPDWGETAPEYRVPSPFDDEGRDPDYEDEDDVQRKQLLTRLCCITEHLGHPDDCAVNSMKAGKTERTKKHLEEQEIS